jgi:hypothetical protein
LVFGFIAVFLFEYVDGKDQRPKTKDQIGNWQSQIGNPF